MDDGAADEAAGPAKRAQPEARIAGWRRAVILVHCILLLIILALQAVPVLDEPGFGRFAAAIGLITLWSAGWGVIHLVRGSIYRRRFARFRAAADGLDSPWPSQVYIVVTPSLAPGETTARVMQAIIAEAAVVEVPTTVVAVVGEEAERRLVKQVAETAGAGPKLLLVRQDGAARNGALAAGLRAVVRTMPAEDAAVVVVEGRSLLPPGILARSLPFLALFPEIDGVTTDETVLTDGGALVRDWLTLRAAQRDRLLASLALSRRTISAAGGFAVLRAQVLTSPEAIRAVEKHGLDDGLRRPMIYLPDVRIALVEHEPRHGFVAATVARMRRCCRAMRGIEGRGLAAGPGEVGRFVWWWLATRPVAAWTVPAALLVAALFTATGSVTFLWAFVVWLGLVGLVETLSFAASRHRIGHLWPALILYERTAAIVLQLSSPLRPSVPAGRSPVGDPIPAFRLLPGSVLVRGAVLGLLFAMLGFATGIFRLPSLGALAAAF